MFCKEQNIWHEEDDGKTVFSGRTKQKNLNKSSIKNESGEEEYFGSTDEPQEPNVNLSRNLFINRILSKVQKSFWSCTHVNRFKNIYYMSIYIFY